MTWHRAAHVYAERALAVFPCAPNAKHPLTLHGVKDATTNHATIDAWAARWPAANLAVATGHRSGVLVIDIDCKNGVDGRATLRGLEVDLGPLPTTLTASTPSRGEHRFFRMPAATVRNSCGKIAGTSAPGFDVRGDGGYVLVAPSSIEGRAYTWTVRNAPAELPTRWANVLTRQLEPSAPPCEPWTPRNDAEQTRAHRWCLRALQDEARALAVAVPGTRNDKLWRAAAALGGLVHLGAIDAEDVRTALLWACSTWRSRTPSKDRQTIENGLRFGLASPRRVELGADRAA